MRLILHIFRKDAMHLWKEIAVTWVLLGWLTQLDCWRYGYLPGSTEGWMNVLLPLAWVYLAGVCVLQDAVPGERQFWLALPARRSVVFGAKALFALVFIHVPYLVSSAIVLSAHGFNPLMSLPHLLQGQLLTLLVLTVPSWALASLARNAMQFILLAIGLAGTGIMVSGNGVSPFQNVPWQPKDEVRVLLALLLAALFSGIVLWIQFRDRWTGLSRGIGLAGVLAACALYLWLPMRSSALVEAAWRPARGNDPITLHTGEPDRHEMLNDTPLTRGTGVTVSIPIGISGLPAQDRPSLAELDFAIDTPRGLHVNAEPRQNGPPRRDASLVASMFGFAPRYYLTLLIERSLYERVAGVPVSLKGHFVTAELSNAVRRTIPNSTRTDVADLGKCFVSGADGNLYQEGGLRLACESPDKIPPAHITLTDTVTERHWENALGARTFVSYPTLTWLSPLNRSEAYFQLTAVDDRAPANWWRVPVGTLRHYRLDADVWRVTGTRVVGYELPGIELSRFVVQQRAR